MHDVSNVLSPVLSNMAESRMSHFLAKYIFLTEESF